MFNSLFKFDFEFNQLLDFLLSSFKAFYSGLLVNEFLISFLGPFRSLVVWQPNWVKSVMTGAFTLNSTESPIDEAHKATLPARESHHEPSNNIVMNVQVVVITVNISNDCEERNDSNKQADVIN